MKNIIIIGTALLVSAFCTDGSFYDYSISSTDNQTYELSNTRGKKCLIFLLPAAQTNDDSLWLIRIDSISRSNFDHLTVIGVPSKENGYVGDLQELLSDWYRSMLDSGIIISKPLFTHKVSAVQQDGLFQWLTHAEKNGHINNETGGPGSMFFINEQGELYGVFGPEAKWSNKIINLMTQ